ncbi:MAG: hypothetical protein ACR2PT_02780, partial [Endozoicomonas sp.]
MEQIGGNSSRRLHLGAVAMGFIRIWLACLLLGSAPAQAFINAFTHGMWPYIPQSGMKKGAVFARAVVLGENGKPIYVEFNTKGEEVNEIGEATGDLAKVRVMSGDLYRSYLDRLEKIRESNSKTELLSAQAYNSKSFETVNQEPVNKPGLKSDTLFVLVPVDDAIFTPQTELKLLELPVNPNQPISSSIKSLLLREDGAIERQTGNNIGYRVGFYGEPDGATASRFLGRKHEDKILNPLPGNLVDMAHSFPGGKAVTNEEGKYFMSYMLPPCPGFTFEYTTDAWLELKYKSFNPRTSEDLPYFMRRQDWDFCNGLSIYNSATFAIVASAATPAEPNIDFPVDLMVISGRAQVVNQQGSPVQFGGQTTYDHHQKDLERIVQSQYDFDGDDKQDYALPGKWEEVTDDDGAKRRVFERTEADAAELQGIWLSSRHEGAPADEALADNPPDLTRLMDWGADFEDRALLSGISSEDLENTDIYVFRESSGQMILERKGLDENDRLSGVDDQNGLFAYTLMMRGPREYVFAGLRGGLNNFEKWQARGGMNPELYARDSDHLRPGERVKIIAINRATGYMGSLVTTMQAAGANGNGRQISFPVDQLRMGPPNLKVWAERKSEIRHGLTRGETREQTIGNEGAGLGDDVEITITSEWLDRDGSPLPEGLNDYGYTGRIARVVAENMLAEGSGGNSVSQFPIRPGRQLQVIRLPQQVLAAQHLYVQVSGEPDSRNPDFSSSGVNEGILQYRPDKFVPFKVPVFDEDSTLLQEQAYRKAKKENPEKAFSKPKPLYQWAYRPELQFSVYDLAVDEIRREDADNKQQDVLKDNKPVLTSSDRFLKLLYQLQTNTNDPLEAYSYKDEKELVFALGEQEVNATVRKGAGNNQVLEFEDLSALSALDSEDFLTMRLYTNNDAGN